MVRRAQRGAPKRTKHINRKWDFFHISYLYLQQNSRDFCKSVKIRNYSREFQQVKQNEEQNSVDFSSSNEEVYNKPITQTEIGKALANSKNTAPDEVHYQMIKNLPEIAQIKFTQIIILDIWWNIFSEAVDREHNLSFAETGKGSLKGRQLQTDIINEHDM